jgi:peptidoglycan/LPS O-acetylase OafA/YrhL
MGGGYSLLFLLIGSPGLILMGAMAEPKSAAGFRAARMLGWISYPVYCLHYPLGSLVWILGERADISIEWRMVLAVLGTLILSVVLAKYMEEPARKRMSEKFGLSRRNP